MSTPKTRIILADDHALFRHILVEVLKSWDRGQIVAQASTSGDLLGILQHTEADVLILDLNMPGVARKSLVRTVRQNAPDLPILILSMHDEPELVNEALNNGAQGYITKGSELHELEQAISLVSLGKRFVSPSLERQMHERYGAPAHEDLLEQLSEREREVLRLLVGDGLPLNRVAEALGVSPKTITTHKANIMTKLKVRTNAELMRYVYSRPPLT